MTTILAQLPVERLGWVLVHSLWQFLAIALVVRLIERTFAGCSNASVRYAAGLCGLAAMTVGPVATWFLIPEAPSASAGAVAEVSGAERTEGLNVAPAGPPAAALPGPVSLSLEVRDEAPSQYSLADAWSAAGATLVLRLRPWFPMMVTCWLIGMSLCSLRPLVGWLTLRRLRTVGVSAVGQVLGESAQRIAARLGVTRAVSVWRSTVTKTPLVVGYLRPVLLIPVTMLARLPLAELEAILAHELAHIRRHDFLVNLWQTWLETVFYYHPAVWSLSQRLRAEREHCCDDLALSVVGDSVCYGRALLHVEELRGPESLLAFGAGGGSLRGRILRLFGQPSPPTGAAGLLAGALLPTVALASLLAAFAGGATGGNDGKKPAVSHEQADEKPPRKPEPAPASKPAPMDRSLDMVIAQHVIVWDGRIRTWDEVVTELREIRRAKGKPIHPNFYFTNGARSSGHSETYQAKTFEVYRELFEPAGVSYGSISPRAGPRYDVLRESKDVIPDPTTLRSGIVVEKGQPKAGVLVVLVPEEGAMPVMLKPDLTLRDQLDEVWTVTGPDGRFTLPVQPAHAFKPTEPPTYALAAISPTAYRLARIPMEDETVTIELLPLGRIELTPVEGKQQRIDLLLRGGLPDTSPGFSIYEIALRDKPVILPLPAGKIAVQRAFLHEDGGSRSYPAETVQLGPGDIRKVTLPNITEEEAERRWIEESLRPKRDPNKPGN
jgi:beta-lactamase regulating signal transducer with metallopeptidase domain